MAPKKLSGAKIARLSVTDLHLHLQEWGVEHSSEDLLSELRAKLERKIVDSEKPPGSDKKEASSSSAQPSSGQGGLCPTFFFLSFFVLGGEK